MFNEHTMSVINSLDFISNQINRPDITVAAITTSDYPAHPNIYNASILVPPTDILMQWADNVPLVMENAYPQYLLTQDPDDMIIALIAALTKKNIVLYIPQDEFAVFGMILLNHIYFVYGITCNFMNTTFSVNPSKIPYILARFYSIDVMSFEDFMAAYPANAPIPEFIVDKMAVEHPYLKNADHYKYMEFFNNMNASKAQNVPPKVMVNYVGGVNQ